jgi:hypothetical protein
LYKCDESRASEEVLPHLPRAYYPRFLKVPKSSKGGQREVIEYAYNLRSIAQLLETATPGLLEAALGFDKLVGFINPLLYEMVRMSSKLNYTLAELDEVCSKYERLESSLQTYIEREEENGQKYLSRIQSLQKKLEETEQRRDPSREADKSMTQESLATLDKLSLPLDALWKGKEELTSLGEGSKGPNASNLDEAACSEPQSKPATVEDAAVLEQGATLESVVQKLEVANKERDKALADLEALRRCLHMENYFPKTEDKLSWLGWVHRLSDRLDMVSTAWQALRKNVVTSVEQVDAVNASLERFKIISARPVGGPTECTTWGDIDQMLEHTNHYSKDRSGKIDWTLEVEEGWVPHNIFSTHFLKENKVVIHTCDPAPEFMDNNCSLCQGPFGPEGAITLEQCRHAFHVTCIAQHSLRRLVCPKCRSPLSSRFYEMIELRAVIPSGHEYNCWNLLLDQLPMKFMNYREWGNPLSWDVNFQCHELFQKGGDDIDEFFWMTKDYEIELRARAIEDDA